MSRITHTNTLHDPGKTVGVAKLAGKISCEMCVQSEGAVIKDGSK